MTPPNSSRPPISASPTLAEAYAGLGLVREVQGQRDAAIVAYQQALHLKPDDFSAKSGLARLSGPDQRPRRGRSCRPATQASEAGGDSQQGVTP